MSAKKKEDQRELRELLLRTLDEAWSRTGWTDRSLLRSLRGMTPAEAAFRPAAGRHSIQESVVHLAYWKHVLARRISGSEDRPFPEKGRDWFPRDGADPEAWARDRRLLQRTHKRLRAAVAESGRLSEQAVSYAVGAAFHDMYHAAQIELTRRLAAGAG
jgi:hypothetical protein